MSTDPPKDSSSLVQQVTSDPARSQLAKRESIAREPISPEIVLDEDDLEVLPPVLAGHYTPATRERARTFYLSVRSMFETWLKRTENPNTQRTYRRGVLNFIDFLGIDWDERSHEFLQVTSADVQAWRDSMQADGQAPSTLNSRISAVSRFYGFMRELASELRLPVVPPNPAHPVFIKRETAEAVQPTAALTRSLAHKLLSLPSANADGMDEVLQARDRAILSCFLYVGLRTSSVCKLDIADFHDDPVNPVLTITEKGKKATRRRVGVNVHGAEALREYLEASGLTGGPFFRARCNPRSKKLGEKRISINSMYRLLLGYLTQLPHSRNPDGSCRYSTHSLRATTATLLDEAGIGIKKIQELLGHKDIRVTQQYIKLGDDTRKSASHDVPL